ncbi:molecular chaperone DnaJ [Sphingomonas nostoxanthinifaciens]|uniref:molecular chaperone DnaJ n=1 Tax=Sphingomonas nostoxanthinifaciens TaxID=2872652 RepID=UPI001CC1DFF9|nr:molecular chaperone DnaJ [Sphingomonas nostoxanthinifaciens]UAK23026.1 molecular chaperone DnaJ [Sphingomonas nostoxanthinifaciens]
MAEVDYYELLEIERTADDKTIKTSYRRLAMQCHPDRNPGCKDSESKFKAISVAYDVLKDPQKRAAYDRYGHAAFQSGGGGGGGPGFEGFSDIFENIFGEFMGGGRGGRGGSSVQRGADLRYDLEISLEDAYHGKSEQVRVDVAATCDVCDGSGAKAGTAARGCPTCQGHGKVRAQQGFFVVERTCPTCHGRGEVIAEPCTACRGEGRVEKSKTLEVRIPPGVDEGTRIRMSGEGEAGARGGPAGDLYIFLHVQRHSVFEREGTSLFARAPISITTAALGGTITVPGLDKQQHEIRIPAGIQSGKQLRQRGAGMPVLNGRGHGDMVVQIEVETPTRLTSRQRELLEEFRATETGEECPQSSGFFARLKGVLGAD